MQKLRFSILSALLCVWAAAGHGQLKDGFYRVLNNSTQRYLTVTNNSIGGSSTNPDLSALATMRGFDNVVSDPASVLYFRSAGNSQYDMVSQGVDTYELTGYHFTITGSGTSYEVSASASLFTFYLSDGSSSGNTSEANISGSARSWNFIPLSQADGQYFGFKPEYEYNGKYYTSIYATFAFRPVSPGVKVYGVDDFSSGLAMMREYTGAVKPYTPVIVECSSASPADNKAEVLVDGTSSIPRNRLRGVLFNKSGNQTAYNSQTMRVLGRTKDGRVGLVKASLSSLPANKAYLTVASGTANELPLMSYDEYEEQTNHPITIRVNSTRRSYGDANPQFTYTVEGGTAVGTPDISCDADRQSPVGTYTIRASMGSLRNTNVAFVEGQLTVNKVDLDVWPRSVTRMQGDPNPDVQLTYVGFRNGEDESVFTSKPTAHYGADENSPVGTYTISLSGGEATNYNFNFYTSTLEVVERRLTAESYTREYGEANPIPNYQPHLTLDGEPELYIDATTDSPAGTYDVVISRGTIASEDIEYVNGTLTITPAYLQVIADDFTRPEGTPNPTFTASYIGFKNGETSDALTQQPIFLCEATEDSAPGQYLIYVQNAESPNYIFSYHTGTLTVTAAEPVTLTANSYTREYGEENPAFGYTSEGATLSGTPELSCEATASSPVGDYPITISKGSVTNRRDTYVNGTLTITPAPLLIAADNLTRVEGEANPVFTATYTGFKNGETSDVLSQLPTFVCEANEDSAPGEYPILVQDATSGNYTISYQAGTLTVTAAEPVTLMADSYTREYGEVNPVFSFTSEGAAVEGTPELSCEATASSPVGTYPIVISKGSVTNRRDTYVDGTLTITPALLLVKVADATMEEGDELPPFELTYQGWKNGDNADVLTVLPVATTTATSESEAGEYPITVSGGEAVNYTFDYASGTLTVKESSGISSLTADGHPADVYTTSGVKVRSRATTLDGLPKGVYVVNRRKVVVR